MASRISIRSCSSFEGLAGAGAAASTGFLVLLYALTIRNKTNPTITKEIIVLIHAPYIMAFSGVVTVPSAAVTAPVSTTFKSAKLTPPAKCQIIGIITKLTKPFTTAPIAPARITATARSITLPVMIKLLNSFNIFIVFKLIGKQT